MKKLEGLLILTYIGSLCFLLKAVALFTMKTDGDGIGLYFLGIEINDRLPNTQIPQYATIFLAIGAVLLLVSAIIHVKLKQMRISKTDV